VTGTTPLTSGQTLRAAGRKRSGERGFRAAARNDDSTIRSNPLLLIEAAAAVEIGGKLRSGKLFGHRDNSFPKPETRRHRNTSDVHRVEPAANRGAHLAEPMSM